MEKNYCFIEKELPNPKSKQIANVYLETLLLSGMTEQMVCKQRRVIQTFLIEQNEDIEEIEQDDLKNWLFARYGSLKLSTFKFAVKSLRDFFRFCQGEYSITKFPNEIYSIGRTFQKSVPRFLTKYEFTEVQKHTADLSLRDRVIVELILATGCRSKEICGLNVENIDLARCKLTIRDNDLITLSYTFPIQVAKLIEEYLKSRPTNNKALFLSQTEKRLTPNDVYVIIHRLGEIAGLEGALSINCLRNMAIVKEIKTHDFAHTPLEGMSSSELFKFFYYMGFFRPNVKDESLAVPKIVQDNPANP